VNGWFKKHTENHWQHWFLSDFVGHGWVSLQSMVLYTKSRLKHSNPLLEVSVSWNLKFNNQLLTEWINQKCTENHWQNIFCCDFVGVGWV